MEKNKIKAKKLNDDKNIYDIIKIKDEKQYILDDIFQSCKDSMKKIGNSINRINDKDLVECKNTWENFSYGKFLLQKILEYIGEINNNYIEDFSNIKKIIAAKHLKKLINSDFSKVNEEKRNFVKEILEYPEFGGIEKYNKNYKLAGLLGDYISLVDKYYKLYDENIEIIKEVEKMQKSIDENEKMKKIYFEELGNLENEIRKIEETISSYENSINSIQNQIDKLKSLNNAFTKFIKLIKDKDILWKEKKQKNTHLLKYFDYYIIFISCYINYAPIFNNHYLQKFKNFLLETINDSIELSEKQTKKKLKKEGHKLLYTDFSELLFYFLDVIKDDRDVYLISGDYENFIKENFIIMHLFNYKAPLIIDHTQYGLLTIKNYYESLRIPKTVQIISYSNNSPHQNNEFKDKIEKSIKNGNILFIDNINNINKSYYYFYNMINRRFTSDKYKKYVTIDDKKHELNENFKIILFKNIVGEKIINIDNNIWFNTLIINFNFSQNDIKDTLFMNIAEKRNQKAYNSLRKTKQEKIKENLKLIEIEKKIIAYILEIDTSGSIDKLSNIELLNEKFEIQCNLYSNCQQMLTKIDNKYKLQKIDLYDYYNKLCKDSSKIFKWVLKINTWENSYIVKPNFFEQLLNDYIEEKEKILNRKEGKLSNEYDSDYNEVSNKEENSNYSNEYNEENNNNDNLTNSENNYNNLEKNYEIVNNNLVIKEKFIYDSSKDAESLCIYIYNKISNIYIKKEYKETLLVLLSFIFINLQRKIPIPFKHSFINFFYWNKNYDDFDEEDIHKSPITRITDKQWSIILKINFTSNDIFQDIIENIENNKEIWNNYLNEKITEKNIKNHYILNNLIFPVEELNNYIDPIIKFLFFCIIKPNKKEFIIKIFLEETLLKNKKEEMIKKSENKININIKDEINNNVNKSFLDENKDNLKNFDNKLKEKNKYIFKSEYIIQKIEDYDLVKCFKNYNLKRDHALILIAPGYNINMYDKVLYNNCYLKMSSMNIINIEKNQIGNNTSNISNENKNSKLMRKSTIINNANKKKEEEKEKETEKNEQSDDNQSPQGPSSLIEVKYKEIILDQNNYDLSQQDYEYIKNTIKIGAVIVIKNANMMSNQLNELLKEMNEIKSEEISPSFKLIFICNINEIIRNKSFYEECKIVNDNILYDLKNSDNYNYEFIPVKKRVLNIIEKIPLNVYYNLFNSQNNNLRLFSRKIIYFYIIIFGLLESLNLQCPFIFTKNDFYCLIKYILNYCENDNNFTEEKYKEFINPENNNGYNYITFIEVMNNIFIRSRLVNDNDFYKINKLIKRCFNSSIFLDKQFYLDIGNIKIYAKDENNDLNFDDIYFSFNEFLSEDFENLLPDMSEIEQEQKLPKYKNDIFVNLIKIFEGKFMLDEGELLYENNHFDINKIYQNIINLQEIIPKFIPYIISDNPVEIEENKNINQALFKKNKYGIYFNPFDESLFYEIISLNKKLAKFHNELHNIINMITGKTNYSNEYYEIFKILSDGKIPQLLNIYNDIDYLNQNVSYKVYKNIILNRTKFYKEWLKEGFLNYYHLPIIKNHELFFYCIKLFFCKKYYGENDYSKVTPDMIILRFITTKYKTYNDLKKDTEYYNKINYIYDNEIVWIDGLMLNNANLDENNKILIFNNKEKYVKEKMNLVGITYYIHKYKYGNAEIDNDDDNNEEEEKEQEESEISKKTENENENKTESKNENNEKIIGDIYNEDNYKDTNKIKVYIYGNKSPCYYNKYFLKDSIGYIEFFCGDDNDINNKQNTIYEKNIKISIEDLDDFYI